MSATDQPVVTRFAPSPTGYLHIGGARTALFNWAFARHTGGKFLLRIEDTDRARSTDEAIDAILAGLDWLGLEPDESPVFQHQQLDRHVAVADALLQSGHAYKCTCTPAELDEMRETARKAGQPIRYDGRCRDKTGWDDNAPYVVRFKAPRDGQTIVKDVVLGDVTVDNNQLDDLVLLRSDRTPTYMLSVVVDDHDMGVTHVIRGDDHLTNAARQQQIYRALGWPIPIFAHIPLIHGPDGTKLSKRHGALGVEAYAEMGYLPAAMRNYLARLGWSHGDEELFSTDELITWFNLAGIGKSPARFDFDKLGHVNAHHLRRTDDKLLVAALTDRFAEIAGHEDSLTNALPLIKEKANTLDELFEQTAFLRAMPPIEIEEKLQKALDPERIALLTRLLPELTALPNWDKNSLEACLTAFMEAQDIKMGQIGPALRACLTGTTKSPAIYDVLYLLGKDNCTSRISAQISKK
ncbi:MAG: glutamate--tRNA ligase [Parvibaculales bacterium]